MILSHVVPPRIVSEGESSVTVLVGDEVTLDCENIGYPPPVISWTKNRRNIDFFDMHHNYQMKESGSLYIEKAVLDDTAHYTCMAQNPAGVATREINFIVHGKGVIIICVPHFPQGLFAACDSLETIFIFII